MMCCQFCVAVTIHLTGTRSIRIEDKIICLYVKKKLQHVIINKCTAEKILFYYFNVLHIFKKSVPSSSQIKKPAC
jgi:hypothetical protein